MLSLSAVCGSASAQVGAISLVNNNPVCTAYAYVKAVTLIGGNGPCAMMSKKITLLPGAPAVSFTAPLDLQTTLGWTYAATPITPLMWTSGFITDFYWSDVEWQWSCPAACIPPFRITGYMSEALPPAGSCYSMPGPWTGFGCTTGPSTWSSPGGTYANVQIIFN